MQFAHNGYYKGSNPLGLINTHPKSALRLEQILLIVHKDASPPSLAYSCLTPPEVTDSTFLPLSLG